MYLAIRVYYSDPMDQKSPQPFAPADRPMARPRVPFRRIAGIGALALCALALTALPAGAQSGGT